MAQCVKRMELECLGCDSKLLRAGAKAVLRLAGGGIFDKFSSLSVQPLAITIALLLYDQSMHMFSTTAMLLLEQKSSWAMGLEGIENFWLESAFDHHKCSGKGCSLKRDPNDGDGWPGRELMPKCCRAAKRRRLASRFTQAKCQCQCQPCTAARKSRRTGELAVLALFHLTH